MIDWDDVRYFLAVARGGSVRAAAERVGVNHATVLRRVAQLEECLGAHMFEKLPSGYRLTAAGEEVLELADRGRGAQAVDGRRQQPQPRPRAGWLAANASSWALESISTGPSPPPSRAVPGRRRRGSAAASGVDRAARRG